MKVCIVGGGCSGLMACTAIKTLDCVSEVILISSPKIPTIGVGESTTYGFTAFIEKYLDVKEFVKKSDASLKYGVLYSGWSKRDFIHASFREDLFEQYGQPSFE